MYATLRGPLFAFHDEDLVAFRHDHGRLDSIRWIDAEPPATRPEVASALRILGELHRKRNRRAIADTISRLLAATRAHAGIAIWPAGEQALANLMRITDLARRFEAGGAATSFRAFIDRLDADAERGRQPDAPVVEEGTEGVRIMTVHKAKGLEFPVVILCDPTAPLEPSEPSRHVVPERRLWLERLAGCVPPELREHAAEVIRRDTEEEQRLAYVAVTRARDLLVACRSSAGDEGTRGLARKSLNPVVYPAVRDPAHRPRGRRAARRSATTAWSTAGRPSACRTTRSHRGCTCRARARTAWCGGTRTCSASATGSTADSARRRSSRPTTRRSSRARRSRRTRRGSSAAAPRSRPRRGHR